jgi:hypothetical protein
MQWQNGITIIPINTRCLVCQPYIIIYTSFPFQVYINWMNFFINLLFPLLVLLFMNVSIYRNMPRTTPKTTNAASGLAAGGQSQKPEESGRNGRNSFRKDRNSSSHLFL